MTKKPYSPNPYNRLALLGHNVLGLHNGNSSPLVYIAGKQRHNQYIVLRPSALGLLLDPHDDAPERPVRGWGGLLVQEERGWSAHGQGAQRAPKFGRPPQD